jgi:hypothetical protein
MSHPQGTLVLCALPAIIRTSSNVFKNIESVGLNLKDANWIGVLEFRVVKTEVFGTSA